MRLRVKIHGVMGSLAMVAALFNEQARGAFMFRQGHAARNLAPRRSRYDGDALREIRRSGQARECARRRRKERRHAV